ncbi:hypothetical protein MBLNU230_g5382t1 [Neophaeotheca triangularis]
MNRFLNKKKAAEPASVNSDALNALSAPAPTSPTLKKSKTSRWKKGKQPPPEEPKPEINYTAALPDTDDFRTSLLMPNLSARFSMLREQDDPSSKLGKASDDSVLQPRRRSRMMDYGFGSSNGLGDIAEVASMKSSIRPPFVESNRADSYGSADGYGTDDESHGAGMMARSRPGEGNNLFGGRQKVYKIPNSGANSTRSLGKAVYEDDVGLSAFQRHKIRERERLERERLGLEDTRGSEDSQTFDFGDLGQTTSGDQEERSTPTLDDSHKALTHSPSLSSREPKRSTSSTGHSDARSSTAATSVASQSATLPTAALITTQNATPTAAPATLERSGTKSRKLYEPALDQHNLDQQASTLTHFNSISRMRTQNGTKSPPFLQTAKSAGSLQERNPQNVHAILRSQSPPPIATLHAFQRNASHGNSPITSHPSSPMSPSLAHFEEDNALNKALEPSDRGKATAMGAFNKPKQAFDENQYLERQRQLQRSVSSAGAKQTASTTPSAAQQRMGRFEQERERSDSAASNRERSRSASKTLEPGKAFNVFQNAASQIRTTTATPQYDKAALPDTHRTFFGNISASDSEDDDEDAARVDPNYSSPDYGYPSASYGRWQPSVLPSVSEHPALRSHQSKASLAEEDELEYEAQNYDPQPPVPSVAQPVQQEVVAPYANTPDHDSPTLPTGVAPLNGLVQHLRQESNQSSLYAATEANTDGDSPYQQRRYGDPRNDYDTALQSRVESGSAKSNPWDLEDMDGGYYVNNDEYQNSDSPVNDARPRAPSATSLAGSRANVHSGRVSEASQGSAGQDWQRELRRGRHNRDASTATQQERDAFASELAQRQKAIQENLKSMAEGGGGSSSRGTSPAPSTSGAFKAFGMLRAKSSRDSFVDKRNNIEPAASSKAMKMLGLGAPASTPALNSQYERSGYSFESGRPRGNSASRSSPMLAQQRAFGHESPHQPARARADSEASRFEQSRHPAMRSPSAQGPRSRANSIATTGQPSSKTGPYQDAMSPNESLVDGYGQHSSRDLTPGASPEPLQSQFEHPATRSRSNSRTTGYFEANPSHNYPSPRPTGPSPPTTTNSTPPRPPIPQSQGATPPLSTTTTPTPPLTHQNPPQPTPGQISTAGSRPSGPLARKKTVSKTDISVPTLVHATSNIDTVDLPEGASLRNGMDEIEAETSSPPPPVPALHPNRKRGATNRFLGAFRRGESEEGEQQQQQQRHGGGAAGKPWHQVSNGAFRGNGVVSPTFGDRKPAAAGHGGFVVAQQQPVLGGGHGYAAYVSAGGGSPERVERAAVQQRQVVGGVGVEGGMF